MAYLALYRQFRPRTFTQVLGQDVITRTLENQIRSGQFVHAYLFCGSRGTGKTSTAKIFARAINCLSPENGNPCGRCEICKMSDMALSADIIEIDAASNNGVDEIRDLRDKVRYAPGMTKYKMYIIDEVHMLSSGAFNALLKTLEEPPEHAVFILATTEMHKLPATILSRCQRFDFLQIGDEIIVGQMNAILKQIGRTADDDALALIARAAEGGMRDALSMLDQCLMITEHLSLGDVYKAIGFVGRRDVDALIDATENGDVSAALLTIDRVQKSGANIGVFVSECMQAIRDRLIHSGEDKRARHIHAMEILAQTQGQMRYATRPRILLDAAAVRLCLPRGADSDAALLARVEQLEQRIKTLSIPTQRPAGPAKATPAALVPEALEEPFSPETKENLPYDEEDTVSPWDDEANVQVSEKPAKAVSEAKPAAQKPAAHEDAKAFFLREMGKVNPGVSQSIRLCKRIVLRGQTAFVAFAAEDEIFIAALRQHQGELERIASQVFGKGVAVNVVAEGQVPSAPIDDRALSKKTEAIFGVTLEIETEEETR
jgi:DNA polymerase-3 subunit gamma/tau